MLLAIEEAEVSTSVMPIAYRPNIHVENSNPAIGPDSPDTRKAPHGGNCRAIGHIQWPEIRRCTGVVKGVNVPPSIPRRDFNRSDAGLKSVDQTAQSRWEA